MKVDFMRIDLPLCNLKTCRLQFDGNCTRKTEYEKCEYTITKSHLDYTIKLIKTLGVPLEGVE